MKHNTAVLVLLVAGACLLGARMVDGKADFEAALQQVERMMGAHKCKEAKALLQQKLAEHADQVYVREHLAAIRVSLKRCSFEIAFPRKGVEDVLCGEVLSYEPKKGYIELRYKKADPPKGEAPKGEVAGDARKSNTSFTCGDFEKVGTESVLKLPFRAPYFVEFDGKAMEQLNSTVRLGIGREATYSITYDFGSLSTIKRCVGEESTCIASSSTFSNVMRPYKIRVSVRAKQIDAAHNGKRIVLADAVGDTSGRFGFAQFANLEEIRVSGQADRAWIDARIEERTKVDLTEFEKTYAAEADLPEWLRAH